MLLVHHDEPQAAEGHVLLDEGVGPHDERRRPAGRGRQRRLARAGLLPGGQERDRDAERLHQPADRDEVLLGQDLRGRHERALEARLDRGEEPHHGDDRLSRAHVALQQPAHGAGPGEVGADLLPHALLGGGQGEGQPCQEPRHQRARRRDGVAGPGRLAPSPDREADLEQQEVLEHEPLPGGLGRLERLGEVDRPVAFVHADQRPPAAEGFGEGFRHRAGETVDDSMEEAPHRALEQPLGEPVDRDDAAHVERGLLVILHDLELRVLHLERPGAATGHHLAVEEDALAALEDLGQVRLVEPDPGEEARLVVQEHGQRHARPSPRGRRDADDRPPGGLDVAGA